MNKKLLFNIVAIMILISIVGSFLNFTTASAAPSGEEKKYRAALIMEGAITDMSWNYTAHQGLLKIEKLGAEIAYIENTAIADAVDALRTFAGEGYDVIFCSGYTFMDAVKAVAPDYPDVQFFIINSTLVMDNVNSIRIADAEQGFLMGALAAMLTKTKTIGFVGGAEITPLINGSKGFVQGAAYVDPDVKTIVNFTGSSADVDKAKELSLAMVAQGVDVLSPMANQASLGVMEAAEQAKIIGIASGKGMDSVAPNAVIVTVVKDTSIAYEKAYQMFIDGEVTDEILYMGVNYGLIYLDEYLHDVPEEVKEKMDEIVESLKNNEIEISID